MKYVCNIKALRIHSGTWGYIQLKLYGVVYPFYICTSRMIWKFLELSRTLKKASSLNFLSTREQCCWKLGLEPSPRAVLYPLVFNQLNFYKSFTKIGSLIKSLRAHDNATLAPRMKAIIRCLKFSLSSYLLRFFHYICQFKFCPCIECPERWKSPDAQVSL